MRLGAGKRLRKFFNGELTDEMIWEEIIQEQRLNNIHQLKTLNREAAEALVKRERRMELLSLGIIELPADVAIELAKYAGEVLLLNCVKRLSENAAKAISQYKGYRLGFKGLRRISLRVLKNLVSYKGMLNLACVENIEVTKESKAAAEKIFKHFKAGRLVLNGLRKPSIMLLKALTRAPGELELNGIKELSPGEAAVLVSHKGKALRLKGLTSLSADLVRIFIKYQSYLDLSSVINIDEDGIKLLATHPEETIVLSAPIKKQVDALKLQLHQEEQQKKNSILLKKKLEEERKKKIEALNQALLKEFEEFDQFEMRPVEPITRAEKLKAAEAEKEAKARGLTDEDAKTKETRLNFEISQKKNRLNSLLRKGFDKLTKEENQEADALRQDINVLKDEIKGLLDIMVEERELGAVVFNSSNDLAKYLKEAGEDDDGNNALENLDEFDLFGGLPDTGDTADTVEVTEVEVDMFGNPENDVDMFGNPKSDVDMFGNPIENVEGEGFVIQDK
ncbi:MAG: hypothetical protein GY757_22060 [bacterium]|nr:hypothetical protein [bacterium]